jgi:hypothetical protein
MPSILPAKFTILVFLHDESPSLVIYTFHQLGRFGLICCCDDLCLLARENQVVVFNNMVCRTIYSVAQHLYSLKL